MSLISCPACGNECSSLASTCPRCGHPFQEATIVDNSYIQKPKNQNRFLIIAVSVLALGIVGLVAVMIFRSTPEKQQTNETLIVSNPPTSPSARETNFQTVAEQKPELPPTPLPSPIEEKATVDIEAAVVYKMGGAQPLAREKFYLLDSDLESILKSAGLKSESSTGLVATLGFAVQYPEQNPGFYNRGMAAIRKHVKYTVLTDFKGKAQFQDVVPRTYYLFGMSNTRGGFAIWNMKTKVVAGNNSIVIDSNNADVAF